MKTKRSSRLYLEDILSAIARIGEYTAKGKENFFAHGLVQDGVIRQLSIIGEASTKLPMTLKTQHPEIPWKEVTAMRNIIVHDYSEINLERIWGTIERDLPVLRKAIAAMLRESASF